MEENKVNTPVANLTKKINWMIVSLVLLGTTVLFAICTIVFLVNSQRAKENAKELSRSLSQTVAEKAVLQAENATLTEDKAALEATLSDAMTELETEQQELEQLTQELAQYKLDAAQLQAIYAHLLRTDAGGVNRNFKSDRAIMVLRKGDPMQSFTLTCGLSNTSIKWNTDTPGVVTVVSAKEKFSNVVTVNVTPVDTGVAVYTFSNNKMSETYRMMFIVVE